ncbi:M42 family metallopeptidase [Aggregatilinea lenta]|uniref:M42 family metallopeptidase n=1 Tax=Aggregatilinea lenta TaxID=913108 RepID=UPI000E5C2A6E|nr:M42 family metallopeptidase [Aggregatilinea lenta]
MPDLHLDTGEMVRFLVRLLNTPSPTGWSDDAITAVEDAFRALQIDGLTLERTLKGALVITWPGTQSDAPRGLTAHVDTLGLIVKEIKPNGRLKLAMIGHYMWNAVEFEGVTVQTFGGRHIRGTVVPLKASTHIYGLEAGDAPRSQDTMEVRLDEVVLVPDDVRALGIEVGDFVFLDPRTEVGDAGFVRSRHLDDKAGVAAIYGAVHALHAAGLTPSQTVTILIANYEEVGHGGASGLPLDLHELVTVDMAVVGEGQNADEFSVGICARDAGGPYHPTLTRKLRLLAEQHGVPYHVDVYVRYGSDGEAYWRSGGAAQVALLGPGVDASHAYERTHRESVAHTAHLIARYLLS